MIDPLPPLRLAPGPGVIAAADVVAAPIAVTMGHAIGPLWRLRSGLAAANGLLIVGLGAAYPGAPRTACVSRARIEG